LEDFLASPSRPAFDVKGIQADLINDPLPQARYRLTGKSELAGAVSIRGTWLRGSNALALMLDAPGIPIKAPLIHSLAPYLPKLTEHARHLEGTAMLHIVLGYLPASTHPWSHNISCRLSG